MNQFFAPFRHSVPFSNVRDAILFWDLTSYLGLFVHPKSKNGRAYRFLSCTVEPIQVRTVSLHL